MNSKSLPSPIRIAAIDAGTNAIRLVIAEVASTTEIRKLDSRRLPVRLGHNVFTHDNFDAATMEQALEAFKHFRALMDRYQVQKYRAVATSACREADNSEELVGRIQEEARIRLEVISPTEEARLINQAVMDVLGKDLSPELIVDLGGGSLEISLIGEGMVERSFSLAIGTVRLIEGLDIQGALSKAQFAAVRSYVRNSLKECFPNRPQLLGAGSAACGGNAEALAQLAPGGNRQGIPAIDVYFLEEILWQILKKDIKKRMKTYRIDRDRAEVIGVAAVVFATLGQWLRLDELLVPGVGIREGVLRDLVAQHYGREELDEETRIRAILSSARHTALRFGREQQHTEKIRDLALTLFDQLLAVHGLGPQERLLLELGAILHDVGHIVAGRGHHKHGEYLVSQNRLPGLTDNQRKIVACLVRYHTRKKPSNRHALYGSLSSPEKIQVRRLSALLRIAERLDADHQSAVEKIRVSLRAHEAVLSIKGTPTSIHTFAEAREKTDLFEEEFGLKVVLTTL